MKHKTISQMFDLTGKTALVTGAAMGIGQAVAERLAEAGAAVVLADINPEKGKEAAAAIRKLGRRAEFVQADTGKPADIEKAVDFVVRTFGGIDILVNNAGIFPFSPALDVSEALWDKVLGINLKGAFLFAQKAAKKMAASGKGGRIVNIASVDGIHPTGNLAHYDASKGGLVMLTKSLALEWGRSGIHVNAVAPGSIATPGVSAMSAAGVSAEQMAEIVKAFNARVPLGRAGDPDEIAKVVLFLASDAASYMTGETVVVDGGYLLS